MGKFPPNDPNRGYSPGTEAQQAARKRNFRIFRLRGLHAQVSLLTGWRKKVARWIIDRELNALGADAETKRQADRRAKWSKGL